MSKKLMSKAEYARHRRVNRATVTGWGDRGLLVLAADGHVDARATDRKLDARPKRYRGGKTGNGDADAVAAAERILQELGAPHSTAEAVRIKENFLAIRAKLEAERREIELAQLKGKLVDEELLIQERAWEGRVLRDHFLALPTRLAPQLILCSTADEVQLLLSAAITDVLDLIGNVELVEDSDE
jgi:hypothetical protein